ncbi:Mammalian cell entry related domain protein [Mycobacterium arosiense]|uniref:Mammalian cell entry related domain protein n=1 Tax=Mycobacterium arosiense ATCC BAA-1401 = DSM 45069 TaxID=1265311 RepID=A0A1W9Z8B9_MYCAI|nr:Mammalian cell entry related domain protein [Mycobacterium arosiense]ORA08803.1 Mammalian cell entry related domain protein [Mycobacterium arosiense ATCC BAA-1401 = DSM 45069]
MLLHASADSEKRSLTIVGIALVLCAVAVGGLLFVFNPFGRRPASEISVVIDTPYVGPGVAAGTALVMHGVKVGEVTAVSSLRAGGVRVGADLQRTPVAGLTDAMDIDFRPVNYFGVTGINLISREGGRPLYDGIRMAIAPKGNFALQALLTRLGRLATGQLTKRLIQVVDKATRYTDALDPMTETALVAANAVAQTQTVSTARLLTNVTGMSVAFPGYVDALTNLGRATYDGTNVLNWGTWNMSDEQYEHYAIPFIEQASIGLFGAFGKLESTHTGDLLPFVNTVQLLTDVVPPLLRPGDIAQTLVELRTRLEKMYVGTPEQRAMQVRIVLDSLPGVAAPLATMGGTG